MLTRDEALRRLASAPGVDDAAIFIGNGLNPRALHALADRPENFYMVGSMGLALPLAIGFGRRSGVPAIAVEGDGNALMGLSALPLARVARPPLVHLILDNDGYESTGGQRSPAPGFPFGAVAKAVPYSMVVEVVDGAQLTRALRAALTARQVCLIHAHTTPERGDPPPRIPYHPAEITARFIRRFQEMSR
jgi:sulfopyruvate decarboxylase subunit beta